MAFVVDLAHKQKYFNNHCVKNGDVRMSCCYAMVTGVPTNLKAFFWAVSRSPVRPVLLPNFDRRFEHLPIR